jgi:hypothetical protein
MRQTLKVLDSIDGTTKRIPLGDPDGIVARGYLASVPKKRRILRKRQLVVLPSEKWPAFSN